MSILKSLLLIILIVVTTGYHAYFVWKQKNYKMFCVQIGIVGITIVLGILAIYDFSGPSISRLIDALNPL